MSADLHRVDMSVVFRLVSSAKWNLPELPSPWTLRGGALLLIFKKFTKVKKYLIFHQSLLILGRENGHWHLEDIGSKLSSAVECLCP